VQRVLKGKEDAEKIKHQLQGCKHKNFFFLA
jgi:hypothetical protein